MWGENKEKVFAVNFIYHLQLLQEYTANLRVLHQKNSILFTDNENNLINNYYDIST